MRKLFFVCGVLAAMSINVNGQQLSLDAMIERDLASWLSTYKMLHAAPELSSRGEDRGIVAGELRKLDSRLPSASASIKTRNGTVMASRR